MTLRVTGLASGMNIDEIVENLIKAESIPLDKMKQEKTILEWKRDLYREMNTLLLDFRTKLTNMKLTSYYRARTVTSSHEDIVTATAVSGAGKGTYHITNIERLATAASKVSGSLSNTENSGNIKVDPGKSIYTQIKQGVFGDADPSGDHWKIGTVRSQTIVVKDPDNIKLILPEGVSVLHDEEIIKHFTVEVDGRRFNVVRNPEALRENDVYITEDGTLAFSENAEIKENSTIRVQYISDKNVKTINISKDTKEISLGEGVVNSQDETGLVTLDLNGKVYRQKAGANEIYSEDGKLVATIDFTSGKITFTGDEVFMKDLEEAIENAGEKATSAPIKITFQQYFTGFSITTFGEDGEAFKENFLIQGSESLNSIIRRVNNSNAGVTMFYDSFSDKLTLTRNVTGDFNPKTGEGNQDGHEIITEGFLINDVLKFGGAKETGGENAVFTINGLETQRTSNTFTMNGVTFTLKNVTEGQAVSINVNDDYDTLFENIKSFVDQYNEIVEKIEGKLNEPRYRSYKPLTDYERERLTEKQQEKWEEMARSGLLKNDSILSNFISRIRMLIHTPVLQDRLDSQFRTLASIGITTTSDYRTAKLEINETKLRDAIENNSEAIEYLFNGSGNTEGEKGIVHRLYDQVLATMDQLRERAGNAFSVNHQFTIGRQLNDIEDKIGRFEERLLQLEDRYYRQFAAMEKAIQRANSQALYLSQFFL